MKKNNIGCGFFWLGIVLVVLKITGVVDSWILALFPFIAMLITIVFSAKAEGEVEAILADIIRNSQGKIPKSTIIEGIKLGLLSTKAGSDLSDKDRTMISDPLFDRYITSEETEMSVFWEMVDEKKVLLALNKSHLFLNDTDFEYVLPSDIDQNDQPELDSTYDVVTNMTSPTTSTLPKAIIRQRLKAKTLKTASNKDLTQEERSKIVSREFVDRLKTDPEFFWQQVRARNILIVDEDGDEVMPSD